MDFFRGLALLCILVDHTPSDRLNGITFQRFGACNGAEVFVLLAGFSAAYAYGPLLARRGAISTAGKALRRAITLYGTNILVLFVLLLEAELIRHFPHGEGVLAELGLKPLDNPSLHDLPALLTFNYPAAFTDILQLYVVLFVFLTIALPLVGFPVLLLTVSFAIYAASFCFGLQLPGFDQDVANAYGLNPLTWQTLLIAGLVLASAPSIRPRPRRAWDALAGLVIFGTFVLRLVPYLAKHGVIAAPASIPGLPQATFLLNDAMSAAGKANLHPLRLAGILGWLWLAYRLAPLYANTFHQRWARPFLLWGRNSLAVFCVGLFLAPVGGLVLAEWNGLFGQIAYNTVSVLVETLTAVISAFHRSWKRRPPAHARVTTAIVRLEPLGAAWQPRRSGS